jgi:hypothetical protein
MMAAQTAPATTGPLTPRDRSNIERRFREVSESCGLVDFIAKAEELKRLVGKLGFDEMTDADYLDLGAKMKQTRAQNGRIRHLARELGLRGGIEGAEMREIITELTKGTASEVWHLAKPQAARLIASLQARLKHAPAALLATNPHATGKQCDGKEARRALS